MPPPRMRKSVMGGETSAMRVRRNTSLPQAHCPFSLLLIIPLPLAGEGGVGGARSTARLARSALSAASSGGIIEAAASPPTQPPPQGGSGRLLRAQRSNPSRRGQTLLASSLRFSQWIGAPRVTTIRDLTGCDRVP